MINQLPVLGHVSNDGPGQQLPVLSTGCGSGACGTSCGVSTAPPVSSDPQDVELELPFKKRQLNLGAVPTEGSFVRSIDLDLTVECNLRCTYCFKEKWNEHMEEHVAFDTIVWMLHASGPNKSLYVNFMGGEPLLRFRLIKKLVPFGKRRAQQYGKRIHFGMTTNGTLVSDEVVRFWRKWGLGFHTSIDGTPDVQDKNRPTTGGRGSSRLVEKSVPKILEYRPQTTARSTVVPETVATLVESYHYFRSLGYVDLAFVPGGQHLWTADDVRVFEEQFREVGNALIADMRSGTFVRVKGIDDYIQGLKSQRPRHACGAGRGLLLVDIHGDIWPCHRWNKQTQQGWRIGSIYEQFNELARKQLDVRSQAELLEQDCDSCVANVFCGGGCPAENLEHTGNVYRRHPNSCELTRAWARVGRFVHDTLYAERNPVFLRNYYPDTHECN